jgi:hypothetical protein
VVQEVSVGVAPYSVVCPRPDICFVSNWGGDPPGPGNSHGISSDTPVRVDPKSWVANHGSVSVIKLDDGKWRQSKSISVDPNFSIGAE